MQPVGSPPTLYHRLRLRFAPLLRWKSLGGGLFVRVFRCTMSAVAVRNLRGFGAHRLRFGVLWGGGICTMKFDKIIFRGRPLGDYFAVTTLLQHSPLPEASELHDTV